MFTSFRQYKECYYFNKKEQIKFSNLVFKYEHVSIYYKLFDPDNEPVMYMTMCNLISSCKKIFFREFEGWINAGTRTIRDLKDLSKEYKVNDPFASIEDRKLM